MTSNIAQFLLLMTIRRNSVQRNGYYTKTIWMIYRSNLIRAIQASNSVELTNKCSIFSVKIDLEPHEQCQK